MEEDSTPQNKQTTNIENYLPPTDDPLNEFPERGVTQGPPLRKEIHTINMCKFKLKFCQENLSNLPIPHSNQSIKN